MKFVSWNIRLGTKSKLEGICDRLLQFCSISKNAESSISGSHAGLQTENSLSFSLATAIQKSTFDKCRDNHRALEFGEKFA